MAGLLYRLGRFSARRRWSIIITWAVIVALAVVGSALFKGTVSPSITIPGTPTSQVSNELAQKFPSASGGSGSIVFQTRDKQPFSSEEKTRIQSFLTSIGRLHQVKATTDPFTAESQLGDQKSQLAAGQAKAATGKTALQTARTKVASERSEVRAAQTQLDSATAQARAAGELSALQNQLSQQQGAINADTQKLDAQQRTLDADAATLKSQSAKLSANQKLLDLSKNIRFVSANGSTAIGSVHFTKTTYEVSPEVKQSIVSRASHGLPGVRILVTDDIAQGTPNLVGPGEIIGLVVALIVLFLMLSTVIGAGLPLISALVGIGVSVLGATAFSSIVQFTSVTTILGIMLGLAVGIDYSLFILNRHRTQLKRGIPLQESIGLANGTSGNAVLFAGSTVIVALVALNITGIPFLGLMGTIGAVSVAVSILVALTFTPAMLSVVGNRILRRKERDQLRSRTTRTTYVKPMKTSRAIITLIVGVAALGIVALPAVGMRLGLPDGSSESTSSSQYKAFKTIADQFGAGENGPLLVVADLPTRTTGTTLLDEQGSLGEKLANEDHVSAVALIGTSKDGRLVAFEVVPTSGPSSAATDALVHNLRALSPVTTGQGRVRLGVAGNASANIDVSDKLSAALPLYLIVVVGLSLIILIIAFRSILVPLTATAGFVLSLLAALGGLTAVYQHGWLGGLFGVHDPAPILSFLPIIEIGVLFGLAMDYQLFLVSGMREAYAHGAPARIAVQRGVRAGRAVVTAAAIIMTSVFSGFIFSDSSTVRPIGFGLAFGVLIDAFVVRLLLIPAAMHLLGRTAWWFPAWLDRIVPNVDVEGAKLGNNEWLDRQRAEAATEPIHTAQ